MSRILNIDTSTEIATVCVSHNRTVIASVTNTNQKDHAAFLQPAIKELLSANAITFKQIEAISVTAGPGSYTGLRVGMASAKGLCYALNIPLITINTLESMALSSIKNYGETDNSLLFCPMIDARRMEVFTALYDQYLAQIMKPSAIIIDKSTFEQSLKRNTIIFSGSGAAKFKEVVKNVNTVFIDTKISAESLAELSYKSFSTSTFANISLAEPMYVKDFYTAG